ncbi:MAG TPA: carboxypeptidase regulatory-like domain-containing protein [Methanomassiliicoccales archaeon]|jgi:C1A family cysteine protease
MITTAFVPIVDGLNNSNNNVAIERVSSSISNSNQSIAQLVNSAASLSRGLEVKSHLMTESEMEAERARVGVYDPNVNYSVTSSGLPTGSLPPTEAQWEAKVGTQEVADVESTNAPRAITSYDLSQSVYFPPVGNQDPLGTCAAWSETYYSYGFIEAKDNGWTDTYTGNPAHLFSPIWTYNLQNNGVDGGSVMGDNTKVIADIGASTQDNAPLGTDFTTWSSEAAWREAPLHKAQGFVDILYTPSTELATIKALLTSGEPIDFALLADGFSSTIADYHGNQNNIISSSEYSATTHNHAQTIVGYDDTINDNGDVGALKVVNSWGTSFGINGYYYVTYKAFLWMAAHTSVGYIVDKHNYQPSLIGVWHYDLAPTRDASISISAVNVASGSFLAQVTPFIQAGSTMQMSTFMCLDISSLVSYANDPNVEFVLHVGSSHSQGNVSSFRIEQYQGQYLPGKASCISNQAIGLPMSTPCAVSSLQQNQHPINISDALGYYDGAFSFAGDAQWVGVPGGHGSASMMQSGDVGDLGTSWLIAFIEGPGTITFDWKVSSESGYDFLKLYCDGMLNNEISGEQGWNGLNYSIPAGLHCIMWSYEKDVGVSTGQDCGWIDNVNWTGRSSIAFDDFEGASSLNWMYGDNNALSGVDTWGNSTYRNVGGAHSAWCAQVGYDTYGQPNNLNHYYDENMNAYMMANLPDLTGLSGVHLNFYYWAVTGSFSLADYAFVQVYDNSTWNTIWTQPSVNSNGWALAQVTVPSDAIYVAFCFYSDGSVGLGPYEGFYVDDMLLTVLDIQGPTSSIGHLSSYTTTGDVMLNCAASDIGGSGFHGLQINYRKGTTGPYSLYTTAGNPTGVWIYTPVDFNFNSVGGAEGTYQFYSVATDNAGNVQSTPLTYEASTVFDATPPVTTATMTGALAPAWNNNGVSLTLSATYGTSGLSKTFYRLDGGAWTVYATPIVVSGQGSHVLQYNSTDNAGNVENTKTSNFNIDTIKPVLRIATPVQGSWHNTISLNVTWTATDSGSGMSYFWVRIDNGQWINVTTKYHTINGLADGQHTLDVRGYDKANNFNTTTGSFKTDTVKPSLNILTPVQGSWHNTISLNVTWTATDLGSGLAYTWVRIDSGQWINVTTQYHMFNGITDGQHTMEVRAYDNTGNNNDTTRVFNVDTVKPNLSIVKPLDNSRLNSSIVAISWSGSDTASGIANYWVSIDGGDWMDMATSTTHSFNALADGNHIVTVKVEDNAGNWNETSDAFLIDTVAPTITAHSPIGSNVSRSAMIVFSFYDTMNTSSLGITVNGVSGTLSWSGYNATFTPSSMMAYNTTYSVMVTGKDLAGNAVEYSWSFITMKNEGVIEGMIKDANGNPIAHALVTLSNGMTTTTDANGNFAIGNVTSGSYNMTVVMDGFITTSQSVSTTAGQTTNIGTLSVQADVSGNSTSDGGLMIGAVVAVIVALLAVGTILFMRRRKK